MNNVDAESLRHRILSLRPRVVTLTLPEDVAVSFRTLSGKDLDALVARLDLPPVELAVAALAQQAQDLPDATVVLSQLPRPTLLRLVRSWAAHPNTFNAASSEIRSFADFKRIVRKKVDEWLRPIRELEQSLSKSIGLLKAPPFPKTLTDELVKIKAASQSIAAMIAETTVVTKAVAANLRVSLPDPELMRQALEEVKQGKAHLDVHGYGFAVFDTAVGGLRLIAREKPNAREIHRAFLDMSRDPGLAKRLVDRVAGSRKLGRREPIVRAILSAHLDRNYALSIPCLYAQLEGILTDLLILEGLARREGSHTVSAGSNNKLDGLRRKAGEYGRKHTAMRTFVTSRILEELSPDRNAVLHGSKTAYRQAKRSASLLLLVDALTQDFRFGHPGTVRIL